MAKGKKGKPRGSKQRPASFQIGPHDNVGAAEAESDSRYLQECFIDTEIESLIVDVEDSRCVVVGRTGSGKSALFARIRSTQKRVLAIEPSEVALKNLTNSNILIFLKDLKVSLRPFYKLLWRHVFIVESLRARFGSRKSRNISQCVSDFIAELPLVEGQPKYRRGFEYLREWGDDFFVDFDIRLKELTTRIESELAASLKIGPKNLSTGIDLRQVTEALGVEEVRKRTQEIVNNVQLKQLGDMIELVGKIYEESQERFFFLVDRLDEDWVEEGIRLDLIRALIETANDFRKAHYVKVIVALRTDLLEQVLANHSIPGFQPEKLVSSCFFIHWNGRQLTELMTTRYEKFAKERDPRGYEESKLRLVVNSMPNATGAHGKSSLQYMIDRTQKRPRDLIAYANLALQNAIGKSVVAANDFLAVEREYGHGRLEALGYEWQAQYPALVELVRLLLKNRPYAIKPAEILSEVFLYDAAMTDDAVIQKSPFSLISHSIHQLTQRDSEAFLLIEVLFKVGILGVKCGPGSKNIWSDRQHRYSFPARSYEDISQLTVHKMLRKYLHAIPGR